jgi:hypothetical protein
MKTVGIRNHPAWPRFDAEPGGILDGYGNTYQNGSDFHGLPKRLRACGRSTAAQKILSQTSGAGNFSTRSALYVDKVDAPNTPIPKMPPVRKRPYTIARVSFNRRRFP